MRKQYTDKGENFMLEYASLPQRAPASPTLTVEGLKNMYKNFSKSVNLEKQLSKKINSLIDARNNYCSITQKELPPFFDFRFFVQHFWLYNDELYCGGIKINDVKTLFLLTGAAHTPDYQAEKTILHIFAQLLRELTTSLDSAVRYYHTYYTQEPSPVFSNINKYFKIYLGELFYFGPSIISSNTIAPFCLSSNNWKYFFTDIIGHPVPPKTFAARLFKLIKKQLLVSDGNFRIQHAPGPTSYYLPYFETPQKIISLNYNTQLQEFGISFVTTSSIDEKLLWIRNYPLPCPTPISEKLTNALYHLTNGNFQLLNKLAILFANIICPEVLSKCLFVISGSPEIKDVLTFLLLEQITDTSAKEYSLKSLTSPKTICELASLVFTKVNAIILSDCAPVHTDEKIAVIKKIIRGTSISTKDEMFGKITLKNTSPIICFPKTHKELVSLTNTYPTIVLDFSKTEICKELTYLENQSWLQLTFPLYGLKLIADSKNGNPLPRTRQIAPKINHDWIINEFLAYCCTTPTNQYVYADELYEAYILFFSSHFGSSPLKRVQFVKRLKTSGNYEYKRPHTSSNLPNKYAFTNLALKENYVSIINSLSSPELSLEENALYKKLEEFDSLIPIEMFY